jgi:hypothetical protein
LQTLPKMMLGACVVAPAETSRLCSREIITLPKRGIFGHVVHGKIVPGAASGIETLCFSIPWKPELGLAGPTSVGSRCAKQNRRQNNCLLCPMCARVHCSSGGAPTALKPR